MLANNTLRSTRIRPNANNSGHELLVTSNVTLAKAAFGAGRVTIDPDSYSDYSGGFGNINDAGWGASGMWVHGGGTGDAAAIAHNGANLYFGIQNGSAANTIGTYMMIEPTGDICMEKNVKLTATVLRRSQHHTGHLEGGYVNIGASETKTNPIFTIGSNYNPNEGTLSNMYGVGYSKGDASFLPTGSNWGFYAAANGYARIFLDTGSGQGRIYFGGNLASETRFISHVTGEYGSMQISNGAKGGWSGYSIDGHSVFMSNGTTGTAYIGIYDDNVNQWVLLHARSAYVRLYYAGSPRFETTNAGVSITGTLTASSTKSFRIPHPLSELSETKDLVHAAIEGPQMDLMYRGKVDLVNGTATVNIDTKSGMTEGTFDVLNRDVQCFTTNETGWTNVKGSVTGNKLTIVAEDNSCTDTISWMVIGERKDNGVVSSEVTDDNGDLIVEPDKQIIKEDPNMDD